VSFFVLVGVLFRTVSCARLAVVVAMVVVLVDRTLDLYWIVLSTYLPVVRRNGIDKILSSFTTIQPQQVLQNYPHSSTFLPTHQNAGKNGFFPLLVEWSRANKSTRMSRFLSMKTCEGGPGMDVILSQTWTIH
jgi:hypothetical protein